MEINEHKTAEALENWLANKPYWEKLVWKMNLEKESLLEDDIELCYRYLSEHLGLIDSLPELKEEIVFLPEMFASNPDSVDGDKVNLIGVKNFVGVNALPRECSLSVGPNLTLIYGGNGTGKSGIGRLLCNACFSRGERAILPNVRETLASQVRAGATFLLENDAAGQSELVYLLGETHSELKRFSVFDSASVLIHLDESNSVNFTPAQIRIFDKVADTILKLESMLIQERNLRRKPNPFAMMFLDNATSSTAIFCKSIDSETQERELLKHIEFDTDKDEGTIETLTKQIEEKQRLDIPRRKKQLQAERQNLMAFRSILKTSIESVSNDKASEANTLIDQILKKRQLVAGLSVSSFDDGIVKSIGSQEWRAFVTAAKELHQIETKAQGGHELTHCLLCHQELSEEAVLLFEKYWKFLESQAELELSHLMDKHSGLLQQLQTAKSLHPKFLETDAGLRLVKEEDSRYLDQLKDQFKAIEETLDEWIVRISKLKHVNRYKLAHIDLGRIDVAIIRRTEEEAKLVDPSDEILSLSARLRAIKDQKMGATVRDAALEYIEYLRWEANASKVSFAGIKMATTKKRTESFLAGVAQDYKGIFNQELAKLDCNFNLVMRTSGEEGDTVKEYRLDFAEDYSPSQILSEGEQNVCSLADFLTEAQLDSNNCGIIFDDPVTSLDHERKGLIAKRLVEEAEQRQVVIFTHDIVFMGQLAKQTDKLGVPIVAHWMRKVDGVPGHIDSNSSPRLTSLKSLKQDSEDAMKDFHTLNAKEQEQKLGVALDYLRSACEALIEEVLFAGTIRRYEDHIRVMNLEEMIFDQDLALEIVNLHGRISEVILAHNRSDEQRERQPDLDDLKSLRQEFDTLETKLKASRKEAINARKSRKEGTTAERIGW